MCSQGGKRLKLRSTPGRGMQKPALSHAGVQGSCAHIALSLALPLSKGAAQQLLLSLHDKGCRLNSHLPRPQPKLPPSLQ